MFTLSNYPDIEMPFFKQNRLSFIYFFCYLTVGIFLLANLLTASVVMNYRLLVSHRLERHKEEVETFYKQLFDKLRPKLDANQKGYISLTVLKDALGGDLIVKRDKRLIDLIW